MEHPFIRGALMLGLVFLNSCVTVNVDLFKKPGPPEEKVIAGQGEAKVVMVDVTGFISATPGTQWLLPRFRPRLGLVARLHEELALAAKDSDVKGLLVRIMSPGGSITGSDIIFHLIRDFKRKKKVPVVACLVSLATSGGYYVALAADEIYALPTTITGSIGVVVVKLNVAGLLKKLGIQNETYTSGPNKNMFSQLKPDTPGQRAIIDGLVKAMYARFVDVVARRRRLPLAKVQRLADGRIYLAPEALKLGLIDKLGYIEDAVARIKTLAGVKDARVVVYSRPGEYRENVYAFTPWRGSLFGPSLPGTGGLTPLFIRR
ncbi:MAG: signal peptide peptidase SppA [Proteobacteria bacterium]|nr:signal peptide peptidase SppA [Pseudomonadota bacterium]